MCSQSGLSAVICSRSALLSTETELRLIANAAIIGDNSQPVNGNSTPSCTLASGMSAWLPSGWTQRAGPCRQASCVALGACGCGLQRGSTACLCPFFCCPHDPPRQAGWSVPWRTAPRGGPTTPTCTPDGHRTLRPVPGCINLAAFDQLGIADHGESKSARCQTATLWFAPCARRPKLLSVLTQTHASRHSQVGTRASALNLGSNCA